MRHFRTLTFVATALLFALPSHSQDCKRLSGTAVQCTEVDRKKNAVPSSKSGAREDGRKLIEQGRASEKSGDFAAAVALYIRALRANEFEAAKLLGDIYATGKGAIPKDYGEALAYYRLAERHGIRVDYDPTVGRKPLNGVEVDGTSRNK